MREPDDSVFFRKILERMASDICVTDAGTGEVVYRNGYRCREEKQCRTSGGTAFGIRYLNSDSVFEYRGRTYRIQDFVDLTDELNDSIKMGLDDLTGVPGRRAGKKCLANILKVMNAQDYFTAAFCDINDLKWVNDTYGHQEGDRLLTFVAGNIQRELPVYNFIFRLSGDEFVVIFLGKNASEAGIWMERMLALLDERRTLEGMCYPVGFSYGFAQVTGADRMSVDAVLSAADEQMYRKKKEYHATRLN